MIRRPPRSTQSRSSAASDVYKRQDYNIFADPDAWGVNNGELVSSDPCLHQTYMVWRAARGEQELLLEQGKAQQIAWLAAKEQVVPGESDSSRNTSPELWGIAMAAMWWGGPKLPATPSLPLTGSGWEGWEWRGPADEGAYFNPKTRESMRPAPYDAIHGPHWDYQNRITGERYWVFLDLYFPLNAQAV